MQKHTIPLLLFSLLLLWGLTACGSEPVAPDGPAQGESLSVVTTIFPEYDWVQEILGEDSAAGVTLLLDSGVDLHSYQPTAEDIITITDCDLLIYVGGESDRWVEQALQESGRQDRAVLCLMDVLGDAVKEEELIEGMETEEADASEDGPEYDEHVWLSLKNAQVLCSAIAGALSDLDPEHEDTYTANAAAYNHKLAALDGEYAAAVQSGSRNTLLFGDRFPFRYLVDDYGLNYYAAFAGCSAESEASFETVLFLAEKADELELDTVLILESSDGKIAQTIAANTASQNQQILTLDSMQSTTAKEGETGASYLSIMARNLDVLRAALG